MAILAILYSIDGQPVQVVGSYINDFLRQGYSATPPNQPDNAIASPLAALTELTGSIDINAASIKDLQSLPQIGVAIAKKIVANRPYKDLPDLIKKIGEVSWMDLRGAIAISEPIVEESSSETIEEEKLWLG